MQCKIHEKWVNKALLAGRGAATFDSFERDELTDTVNAIDRSEQSDWVCDSSSAYEYVPVKGHQISPFAYCTINSWQRRLLFTVLICSQTTCNSQMPTKEVSLALKV